VLLTLLLAADLGFIILHVLTIQRTRWARRELLLTLEGTVPEHYQHVKLAWVALLFVLFAYSRRRWLFLPWAALFGFLVVDDFLGLHEFVGWQVELRSTVTHLAGLPVRALGELLLPGVVVAVLAPFLLWSLFRGHPSDRSVLRTAVGIVAVLAVFGVGVDLAHAAAPGTGEAWKIWGLVEEGGELFVSSVLVAYLFATLTRPQAPVATEVTDVEAPAGRTEPARSAGDQAKTDHAETDQGERDHAGSSH
jgi:hypothetical protein